ncbi:MAG: SRPBCC family protein [Nocardioides sp.]
MNDFSVTVEMPHPPSAVFKFLADPRNRPLWQASLKSVADVDAGEPRVGMSWTDVTKVGLKPAMSITELTPFRVLTEKGTWRGVEGVLTMKFVKTQQGTRLTTEGRLTGQGAFALAAAFTGRLAPQTVRKDLLRASEILSGRPG